MWFASQTGLVTKLFQISKKDWNQTDFSALLAVHLSCSCRFFLSREVTCSDFHDVLCNKIYFGIVGGGRYLEWQWHSFMKTGQLFSWLGTGGPRPITPCIFLPWLFYPSHVSMAIRTHFFCYRPIHPNLNARACFILSLGRKSEKDEHGSAWKFKQAVGQKVGHFCHLVLQWLRTFAEAHPARRSAAACTRTSKRGKRESLMQILQEIFNACHDMPPFIASWVTLPQ